MAIADPPPSPLRSGPSNDLSDVEGVRVGHHQRDGDGWLTGTTVVVPPEGSVAGVDVRGGGPSTRETDALGPTTLVDAVHAICLSGGSSYGLAAATGVMEWLGERSVGLSVGEAPEAVVPIVPGACLFDLRPGAAFGRRPDAGFGRAAMDAASAGPVAQGNVGAGTGGHAGRLKGGIGSASVALPSGSTVAALVALNSSGSVVDVDTGELYGLRYGLEGEFAGIVAPNAGEVAAGREAAAAPWPRHTILAVVATDATLAKHECTRVAMAAHDGMARAVRPAHGMTDGDVVFCLSTRRRPLPEDPTPGLIRSGSTRPGQLGALMAAAADTVARAIVHATLAARSAGEMTSYLDRYPSALA